MLFHLSEKYLGLRIIGNQNGRSDWAVHQLEAHSYGL